MKSQRYHIYLAWRYRHDPQIRAHLRILIKNAKRGRDRNKAVIEALKRQYG